ncbi:MAG: family 43 glycosylhydrolase [Paludibacteraceae bacterium]|nr:family 43 glycosylhydrolase [Paludibacteraceae bacterium]
MKSTKKLIMGAIVALTCHTGWADNPIIQTYYSPDPAPVVIDDTVFVYTGNDLGGDFFTMDGWRVSSSTDMVNWTDRGTIILSSRDFPNANRNGDWAAQVIRRNGKYYYYVTVSSSTGGGYAINVGVADRPEGPFKNALGDRHLAGPNWSYIDPTVWIDDDGQAYLYWGNSKLFWAKLNEDMISFNGGIHEVDMSRGFSSGGSSVYTEGPWIHKRDNKYYMLYASHGTGNGGERISYSTSDSPTGPWTWGGLIMEPSTGSAFTNHCGIIDFKGRSFFFYHNQRRVPGAGGYNRTSAVEEFTWNADGSIPKLKMTDEGVIKPIHYVDPFKRVEAETKAWSYGVGAEKNNNGVYINKIHNNDYIKVRCLDFGEMGADFFTASVSSKNNASIEIHLDKQDGELIGTLQVENTNGAWREIECEVANTIGKHDIFFVFKGASNVELFDFDYWYFTSNSVIVPQTPYNDVMHTIPGKIEFEDYDEGGQNRAYYDADMENQGNQYREDRVDIVTVAPDDDPSEGYAIGFTNEGEWLEYSVQVKESKAYEYELRTACGLNTSGIQLFLDDKEVSQEIEIPNTEDWNTYTVVKGKTGELTEGEHILRVLLTAPYANLDWIRFIGEGDVSAIEVNNEAITYPFVATVYDLSGRLCGTITIQSSDDEELRLQLRKANLPAGTYLIKANQYHRIFICK